MVNSFDGRSASGTIEQKTIFAPFDAKNGSFYQDRLGTNTEKVEKKDRFRFFLSFARNLKPGGK